MLHKIIYPAALFTVKKKTPQNCADFLSAGAPTEGCSRLHEFIKMVSYFRKEQIQPAALTQIMSNIIKAAQPRLNGDLRNLQSQPFEIKYWIHFH